MPADDHQKSSRIVRRNIGNANDVVNNPRPWHFRNLARTASQRPGKATLGGRRAAGKAAVVASKTRRSRGNKTRCEPETTMSGPPGQKLSSKAWKTVAGQPGQTMGGPPGKKIARRPGKRVAGKPGQTMSGPPGNKMAHQPGQATRVPRGTRARAGAGTRTTRARARKNRLEPTT